ncbi:MULTISPECIES: hypothetical protein [unclassified Streptomyces]|uniref:hypothetical protein n=1 Tax=unclassified Streptomyces TaxID=2593676 RepID=UPI0018FEF5FB|nr:hypothetical protein [Streptomyces sp. NRRL F-5630]
MPQELPKPAVSPCAHCAQLTREEREAEERGDLSRAVDCRVLISRHPHEGGAR